jgi:CBS-domain-containing membrane protein
VAGKHDWLAHGLPSEGSERGRPTAEDLVKTDVVTCGLHDSAGAVGERVNASAYPFAVVVSGEGVVLGRIGRSALSGDPAATAEDVMAAGPSTVRPDVELPELVERLRKRDFHYAIVTLPEGKLVGIVRRTEAEQRALK